MPFTTTNGTSYSAWNQWVLTSSTTSSTSYERVWGNWTTSSSITFQAMGQLRPTMQAAPPLTPEQQAEQRRLADERARQYAADRVRLEQEAKQANERAEALLRSALSPEQNRELTEKNEFTLTVHSGEEARVYTIHRGFAGNIHRDAEMVTKNGTRRKVRYRYCIHPDHGFPDGDAMLAQKLLLETNEAEFLRIANRTELPLAV